MKRFFLLVGDRSSAGGTILDAEPASTDHGARLAFVGAEVRCDACQSTGRIVARGPRRASAAMHKIAALDGDLCVCDCVPAPVMLASQDDMFESFNDDELASMGFTADGTPIDRTRISSFDERVRVVDENYLPLTRVPYHIRTSGGVTYKGITDASGFCPRVYTRHAETLDIALGMKALDRWKQ
jgi:uncharacterized Zn-binding protein involved in type VI secretion